MGWATGYIVRLQAGETVQFRPRGHSMRGKVESGQKVTVVPAEQVEVGDIVLARVAGTVYLHWVSAVDASVGRVQISNNRGRVNGWTTHDQVYGICLDVEGRPRPGAAAKVRVNSAR